MERDTARERTRARIFADYFKLYTEGNGEPLEYLKEKDYMTRHDFLKDYYTICRVEKQL